MSSGTRAPTSSAPASSPLVATSRPAATVANPTQAGPRTSVATSVHVTSTISTSPTSQQVSTSRRLATTLSSFTSSGTVIATQVIYDPSAEQKADSQQTNKILIGIFSVIGTIFLSLIAFQLVRCYKRRSKRYVVPLPPPRENSMSQLGYRSSRAVSIYKDYPIGMTPPPSATRHGSALGLTETPSIQSHAPSAEALKSEDFGRRNSDPTHDMSQENSISEEAVQRPLSHGSSPNLSLPRPPSQTQLRPESRARIPRSNSVTPTSRQSYYGVPTWQGSRNSMHEQNRRASYYASGNRGPPHAPHARDRVGLVMPQPLAPELFSHALGSRQDTGSDSVQGEWGVHGNLISEPEPLTPRVARPDSWVVNPHSTTTIDNPVASNATLSTSKDGSLSRGRAALSDVPRV